MLVLPMCVDFFRAWFFELVFLRDNFTHSRIWKAAVCVGIAVESA
jgi:hypothetical protein